MHRSWLLLLVVGPGCAPHAPPTEGETPESGAQQPATLTPVVAVANDGTQKETRAFAALSAPANGEPRTGEVKPFATRDGREIRLEPSGVTFRIPPAWLDYHREFGKNLHLTRAELDQAKDGGGEWDTEYAAVANAALPFDRCAAHAGSEAWGLDGVSFGDLQMRAYVVTDGPEKVAAAVSKGGLAAAAKYDKRARADGGRAGDWHRATVRYGLWYGDYGGTAMVDVYARPAGKDAVVLVFMHAEIRDYEEPIADMLKSVKIGK